MKTFKGCANHECKSYVKKVNYKSEFEFCPICGLKLEYVCADCRKVLDNNGEKLCIACKTKHEQEKAQQRDIAKNAVTTVFTVLSLIRETTKKKQ